MEKLEALKKLISIKSFENSDDIVCFLKNYFEDKVIEIKTLKNEDGKKSILIGINTKLKNIQPIVLSGHIDTVMADIQKYQTNPYELTIKDGMAYGLGVIDMKCFTASIIDKLNELKDMPVPIIVALTTDEETTFSCIRDVIKYFQYKNIKPLFTIVGEPTKCQIMSKSYGCYEYEIEVFGKSAHSSLVDKGINAINVLAKIITFIENEQKNYNNLTSNCGVISGGDIVNRVPYYAKLDFDIRTIYIRKYQSLMNSIKAYIGKLIKEYGAKIKLSKKFEILPLQNVDCKIIEKLVKNLKLPTNIFIGGSEAGYFESIGSPTIIFGVGDLALAHKPNEYMIIGDYFKYNKLLVTMIKEIIKVIY